VDCVIELDAEHMAGLAQRIRDDRKAHPLVETARKVLEKPKYLRFTLKPQSGATVKFHACAACGEPFLNCDAVVNHQFHRHGDALFTLAQAEIEPPKGNFVLMACCGWCREPLCPPNFHKYTEILVAHHRRHHAREYYEDFKSRVKMSREAEDLDAWKKSLSVRQEFQCKLCEKKFLSRAEMIAHLGADHGEQLEKKEEQVQVIGEKGTSLDCSELRRVVGNALRQQEKMIGPWLGRVRQALNVHGLQFFRNLAGHQFVNHIQPRLPAEGELADPILREILHQASEPARRGHKPTHKTLAEYFCVAAPQASAATDAQTAVVAEPPAPQSSAAADPVTPAAVDATETPASSAGKLTPEQVQTAIDELIRHGFLIEYLDGELDAPALARAESAAPPALASTGVS
jgi:hypothetical protein